MAGRHRVGVACVAGGLMWLAGAHAVWGQATNPFSVSGPDDTVIQLIKTGSPNNTWQLLGNESKFEISHPSAPVSNPFTIEIGAPRFSFKIEATGNIGLFPGNNFNNPERSLHINVPDSPALRLEQDTDGGNPSQAYDLEASELGFKIIDVTNANKIPFNILPGAPTNSLFVAANGSVGMGTSTPDVSSKLDIRSSLTNGLLAKRADAGPHFLRVENSASAFRCGVQGNGDTQFGALTPGKGLALLAGGTGKVAINASGQISFGNVPPAITTDALVHTSGARLTSAGVWTNGSSRTLKQDIEPITSEQARDTVRALQPVGYRYKAHPEEPYVGFIAEDVPELVATSDRKSLAPMDIVAVLTKVVQDQQTLLDAQQKKLEKLEQQEATIATLMARLDAIERANAVAPKRD